MNKGFIFLPLMVLVSVVLSAGALIYANHEVKLAQEEVQKIVEAQNLKLGATSTTISETIETFRTNVNAMADELNGVSTSLRNVSSGLGTIADENTPLAVDKGGTATTTTPTNNQFFSTAGTTPTWKTFINTGSITVSSTATSTSFNTPGFNATANINFTGSNQFAGTSTFNGTTFLNASTSVNATTTLNANLVGPTFIPTLQSFSVSSTINFSTTTTSFVTIGTSTTNGIASTTLTLSGTGSRRVLMNFTAGATNPGAANTISFNFSIDDTLVVSTALSVYTPSVAGEFGPIAMSYLSPPLSAGAHTFRAVGKTSGATLLVGQNDNSTVGWTFNVIELY